MKTNTIIIISLFFFMNIAAQEIKMDPITKIINEIKTEYAPDKRVALFEVNVSDSSGIFSFTGKTNIPEAKEKFLDGIKKLGVNYKDNILLLPNSELGENVYGIVHLSVANIRSAPDHAAELATQSLLGTPVKIFQKESGFYLVQTPDNYIAWVDDDGIIPVNKQKLNDWLSSDKIIYTKEYGFSFSHPNASSQHVSDLVAGNTLINLGEENNFLKVMYPDGRIAFVEKNQSKIFSKWIDKQNPKESSIVSTAKLFIGIPYLWGGTSAKGMDCSGFTKTVYFLNGIILERDASQQVNTGVLVDTQSGFENLRAGDLLFFGYHQTDSTKERITHVGIYIGNYEYIHAAGRIKINSLNKEAANFNEYRLSHFIRAKRILTSIDKNGISSIKNNVFYSGKL